MPAGRHDHRATIQTKTDTVNVGGNVEPMWNDVATRWASLEDTGGRELVRAQKIDATIDAVITLREQYDGLTVQDRIEIDSRTFEIKAILGSSDRTAKRGQFVHVKEVIV